MRLRKPVKIILLLLVIVCAAGAIAYNYVNSQFHYNPDNILGNTTGNLNNKGLFCEYNNKIYFSNPCDKGHLYVMNSDCTEPVKLNDDTVNSINVYGEYIYYVKNNFSPDDDSRGNKYGVFRTDLLGQNSKSLHNSLAGVTTLYGNYIYYQHYDDSEPLSFYKIKIDGTDENKLSSNPINPASISKGKIYFSDNSNKNCISSYDTDTEMISLVYPANSYMVDVTDNYIYYIDLDKNYSLVRLNLNNHAIELLYENEDGKVINYNRYGNKIFFLLEGNNPGLYRMNSNGTQVEFIASGNISSVNCTSQYTFFQYLNDSETLYRVPTTGSITKIEEITIK